MIDSPCGRREMYLTRAMKKGPTNPVMRDFGTMNVKKEGRRFSMGPTSPRIEMMINPSMMLNEKMVPAWNRWVST